MIQRWNGLLEWLGTKSPTAKPHPRKIRRGLVFESLESRHALAAAGVLTPAITGTVFLDANGNGSPSAGEEIVGATVRLFVDDGDGVFEPATDDTQFTTDRTTDFSGVYCFDGLLGTASFWVFQPAQTVGAISLPQQVSPLTTPGRPGVLIDSFNTTQFAMASPPAPSSGTSSQFLPNENEVIGAERDVIANLDSGDAAVSVEVNPFGSRATLRFNADVGGFGRATIVWDGRDDNASGLALGLNGRDLTDDGANTGIMMLIGTQMTGSIARLRLFQGSTSNFSETSFTVPPTNSGMAEFYQFLPFSGFTGPVSATNVDAIELLLDSTEVGANDVEVDIIGANGPKTVNFVHRPTVDLSITKDDNQEVATPGTQLTYTITVRNNGPIAVTGARVTDAFPSILNNVTYTSAIAGSVSGHTASGNDSLNETLNMAVGSSVVYTVSGTIASSASGSISNTAIVTAPAGVDETDDTNNTATDVDTLVPQADLRVTKTDNRDTVTSGDTVTYSIVVTNVGPSDVNGASVADTFPAGLSNVAYTSVASGNAAGNRASGTGAINDTVNMPAGGTITYTVTARVASSATGQLSNTVTVSPPDNVQETNPNNNSATDVDAIDTQFDLVISKNDGITNLNPADQVTYTIVVRNDGPSDATGVTVRDIFPSSLTDVTYTSSATAGATGNTAAGSNNINDIVNLSVGGSITYTVSATVANSASGTIENTATVTASNAADEIRTSNNTATDIDNVIPEFDLSISKTDNRTSIAPGQNNTYTIAVTNSGPSTVTGASVVDNFPSSFTDVRYTSTATAGASGNTPSGTGNIADTVNLPADSRITYTVTGTVAPTATGQLTNTATVTAPAGMVENNTANNSANDVDTLTPQVDLSVTKTDNRTTVSAGDSITYEIVVSNAGPSTATGATIADVFPSSLSNVRFTSRATGGATGNTASGTGNINQIVNLPPGSSITYTVSATVSNTASSAVSNTVSVAASGSAADTNSANNSATDVDNVIVILRTISGFVYVDRNNDGRRDTIDPPISQVALTLQGTDNAGNAVSRMTVTDAAGFYEFDDLIPGNYTVRETQPFGFGDGRESVGTGARVNPTVADNMFSGIGLGAEQDAINFNFGELRPEFSKRDLLASSFGG